MRDSVIWVLSCSLFATALAIVHVRHQHRLAYASLQSQIDTRDGLNDDWGRLLIEENLWSAHSRIERHATEYLGMRLPTSEEVEMVVLTDAEFNR